MLGCDFQEPNLHYYTSFPLSVFFDTFLHVEQEFIPKKFQKLCLFKGQPWLAWPSKEHDATDVLVMNYCSTYKKVSKNTESGNDIVNCY